MFKPTVPKVIGVLFNSEPHTSPRWPDHPYQDRQDPIQLKLFGEKILKLHYEGAQNLRKKTYAK